MMAKSDLQKRWLWEDWLDVLWDRAQQKHYGKDLFRFLSEKKIQAALRQMRDPGWQVQMKRMERLKLRPVKSNPLLTREYLEGGSGLGRLEKLMNSLTANILSEKFERTPQGILGGVKYCPPETVSRQKKKMGRPTKYHRPMSDRERQRKRRGEEVFRMRKYSHALGVLGDLPSPCGPYRYPREPWLQLKFLP
jgi:hypothetical protein